jgi:glucose 1-dehydrogenase
VVLVTDGVSGIGRLEEVTSAVIWLLSEQASYVTGVTLSIDGGMSAE